MPTGNTMNVNRWNNFYAGTEPAERNPLQLQLYTAKSQYWLHKAGASPEHWQFKINNLLMKV